MDSTDFDSGLALNVSVETIKREMANLVQGINAVALAGPLREQAVLNDDLIDKALAMAAPVEQNRSLMHSLRNVVNDERLEAFLTCLTSSGHEELADKLKKTHTEVDSAFGSDGATAAPWPRSVVGGNDTEQGTNLVVPREEQDKQEWLATSFSRYRNLWLHSLKFTDTFVDELEENEVPPYIISRVEEVSRRRKVPVLLDMLSTAGLQTYDAFKVALEKTEQNDLIALLEEKPRDEAERLLIGQRKEELAHLVPSVVVRVAVRELPAQRLKLNIPRPPDKADDALMVQVVDEIEKCYGKEPVAKLFEELLPRLDLKNPALAIEQVARELFADRSVTMSAIAVFLCISVKVVVKVIPETPKHVTPLVRAATDTLCQFAFWLTRCGGWAAFVKDARTGIDTYVGKVNWNRFLSKTKKQGAVIVGPPHAESDAAVAALCTRLSRLLPIDVVSAADVADMLTQFNTGAPRLLDAFRMSSHGVVVVVATPGARGGNTGPPWFRDLVGVLETAPGDTRRLLPVGFFGAKSQDFIPAVRSLKVVEAFPNKKKWKSEALIDAEAEKIKIEYDTIMQKIVASELHGGREMVIELKLFVQFRNDANMSDGLKKAHAIQIRTIVKSSLIESNTDLRKFLAGGFDIFNIRVPLDEVEDPMIVEVVLSHPKTPNKIVEGLRKGTLAKLFSEKVVCPPETPEWWMKVTSDEQRLALVQEKLERRVRALDAEDDSGSLDDTSSSFMQSGEGASLSGGEVGGHSRGSRQRPEAEAPPRSGGGNAVRNVVRARIVGDVLKSVIDKEEYNPYDLLLQMERYQHDVPLAKVRDCESFNILHMAVFSQEPMNLTVVFYMNLWGELRQQVVEPGRGYSNLTPRGLAEKLMFKSQGPRVAEEFDYLEARFFTMSDLSKACLAGKQQFVSPLLTHDTSGVNAPDGSGSTPLFYAAAAGHVDLMELLVKHGADAAVVNDRQETCLHVAASLGRADAVDFLLRRGVLDPNAPDSSLMRPIEYAAVNGDLATLKAFQRGRVPLDDSLVCLATKGQRVAMVRYLVDECGRGVEGVDPLQRTPLHHAAIQGHEELLSFLVRKGANLSHRDKIKKNLLHHLAEHYKDDGKRKRAAKYLIELLQERGLMRTMVRDHDIFGGKELLMLVRGRDKGRRAWHYVEVKRRKVSQFKKKLASGFIDVLEFGSVRHSGFGMNPGQDVLDEIDKLVDDRLSGDSKDCTPLHLAVSKDHTSLVIEFIALGADVNAKDYFGLTPLHLVAITGNMDVAKLLEEKGASFAAKDVDGKTAKDMAEDNEQERVLNFLRGQETFSLVRNFVAEVKKNCVRLDEPVLQAKRAGGQDVKHHIVAVLRDVQIDINTSLLDLGFGPIMEETEPGNPPGASQYSVG